MSADTLRTAVESMIAATDMLDEEVCSTLEGRRFMDQLAADDESDAGGEDPSTDEQPEEEELPSELRTILQLDPEGNDAVSAHDAALICHRDSELVLALIRQAEEQVIAWRKSVGRALEQGDSEEAAVCEHEGDSWQQTVDLLRGALRLIVLPATT